MIKAMHKTARKLLWGSFLLTGIVGGWSWFLLWGNGRWWRPVAALYFCREELLLYAPSVLAAGVCAALIMDIIAKRRGE